MFPCTWIHTWLHIETVSNRNSPPAILLREGWREDGKVKRRTLAHLSKWPREKIETLRRLLGDEPLVGREDAFDIVRARSHGHVAAVLGTLRKLALERLRAPWPSLARVRGPGSRPATARGWAEATAAEVSLDGLYAVRTKWCK